MQGDTTLTDKDSTEVGFGYAAIIEAKQAADIVPQRLGMLSE